MFTISGCFETGHNVDNNPYLPGVISYTNLDAALTDDNRKDKDEIFLAMSYQNLDSLSFRVGDLNMLTHIELRGNNLSTLPIALKKCINIYYIDISNNKFTDMPEVFIEMPWVFTFKADSNMISEIPMELRNIRLGILSLAYNRITKWPDGLTFFEDDDLIILDLTGNPIPLAEQDRIRKLLPRTEVRF